MNTPFIRSFVMVVMALAAYGATLAQAGALADGEAQKIQGVIVAQIEAFAEDDADGAFQTATPSVREAIGNPGRFLAMVRGAYPMVYRPASVTFHKPEPKTTRCCSWWRSPMATPSHGWRFSRWRGSPTRLGESAAAW